MCQCYTNASGEAIICPPCATSFMQALLGKDQQEEVSTTLTQAEYNGLTSLVNGIDGYFQGIGLQSQEARQ